MSSALFVSHTGEKGGAELFLADVVRAGPKSWEACFLSDGEIVRELEEAGKPPIVLKAGAKMLSIRRESSLLGLFGGVRDVLKVAWQLSRFIKDYDVVCANSQKALFVCAMACVISRKPLVWFLHDIVTDPAFSAATRRASVWLSRLLAKRVVVNSKQTGQAFVAAGGNSDKVRIVHNGFEPDQYPVFDSVRSVALRNELRLPPGPMVGLFGRLTEWKGQHVFLHALARLEGVNGVVVGSPMFGQEAYEAELRTLCEELRLNDRVRFLGFRRDVPQLMSTMDMIVHTSIVAEPFGRVVAEALLCGRPVVATAGGGVDEIIRHEDTGLVVSPGSDQLLAESMGRLLAEKSLAEGMGARGRVDMRERFSLSHTVERIQSVLAETSVGRR